MKRLIWFLIGFIAIVMVVLVWLQAAGMLRLRWPLAQPNTIPPTRAPSASPPAIALSWERDILLADRCDVLQIDRQGRALYGACRQSLQAQQLLPQERATLQGFINQYAADDMLYQTNPGGLDNETIRLRFAGQGTQPLAENGRAAIVAWSALVHERLTRLALQANLTALARGHLAGRLNVTPGAISVVLVEPINWVDSCLGIPLIDPPCAPIVTPGLRIVLAANGVSYEYRTDLLGKVLPFDLDAAPGLMPTSVVDQGAMTAVPTELAKPTILPTATPVASRVGMPTTTPTPTRRLSATAAPQGVGGWIGAYYANRDLIEPPVMRRDDATISFNWGDLSPDPVLPDDRFAVRWTRRIDFRRGYYRFDVQADDGARLWVDNVLVLDHWRDGYTEHQVEVYLAGGLAPVVLEYYENQGLAEVGLSWRLVAPGARRTATPTPEPVFSQWRSAYYNNTLFVGDPVIVRNDERIDFDWNDGAPADGVPADRFSVRWSRRMWFSQGAYRFNASVDDGMRLWIDGRLAIDDWRAASVRDLTGYRWLEAGWHDLRMDYFDEAGMAEAKLDWTLIEAFPDWRAAYYDNDNLDGDPVLVRNETEIDHQWSDQAPLTGIPSDDFSVRWTRRVYLGSGRYRFDATVDDGVRLYLDNALLIDEWHDADQETYARVIDLFGGYYDLRVDYYEHGGGARCTVGWSLE